MTAREIARVLLSDIGVHSFNPTDQATSLNQRGLGANDLSDCAIYMTGALQEIYQLGPAALSHKTVADVLRPSANITFTATQYATSMASVSGYSSWMNGCTVRVAGDDADNRLVNKYTGTGTNVTLLRPYTGTSGAVTATVFGDAIVINPLYSRVIEPVELPNRPKLIFANSAEEFRPGYMTTNFNPWSLTNLAQTNKNSGTPVMCYCENEYNASDTGVLAHLRFNPMPDQAYPVTYRVKVKPPTITAADLDVGSPFTSDPGTVLPLEMVASTWLPFARQRWQSHSAVKLEPTAVQEIARQYEIAKKELMTTRPSVSRERGYYPNA